MRELLNQYFATDKDIFDLLMSAKQKITESVLRELAKDRGIFYSPQDSRDDLVELLSGLPHDFHDVTGLMHRREHNRRGEKTTSVLLDANLSVDEIRAAVAGYQTDVGITEKVTSHQRGEKGFVVNIQYDEIDYSRTRLIQRQRQDAVIEFSHEAGKTLVRLPATAKAQNIVSAITHRIESERKAEVPRDVIELVGIDDPDKKTHFFIALMSKMNGYQLRDVTTLKVAATQQNEASEGEMDLDDDDGAAEHEMMAYVRNMALSGQNLLASQEYQQLRKRGFYITSITWRSEQTTLPRDIIEFTAEFEDAERGAGFKYSVKGAYRFQDGEHTKTMRHLQDHERLGFLSLLEATARVTLNEIKAEYVEDLKVAEQQVT